jgi:hypothetical protein
LRSFSTFTLFATTSAFDISPSASLKNDPAAHSARSLSEKKRDGHKKGSGVVQIPVFAALNFLPSRTLEEPFP